MHTANHQVGLNTPSHQTKANLSGFALVATISVMVMMVMIALAMLSLSTIELRSEHTVRHQEVARANARMALMIALGDLQKYAGADQRVTARADITSQVDDATSDPDPSKKYWTGVWNTQDWNPLDPDAKVFENWLVFTPRGKLNMDDVKNGLSGPDLVTLLGDGYEGLTEQQLYPGSITRRSMNLSLTEKETLNSRMLVDFESSQEKEE